MPVGIFKDASIWACNKAVYRFDGDTTGDQRLARLLGVDEWSKPEVTLERKFGDCEDFALLCLWKFLKDYILSELTDEIIARIIIGLMNPQDKMSWHAWAGIWWEGKTYWTDPTRPLGMDLSTKHWPPFAEAGWLAVHECRYAIDFSLEKGLGQAFKYERVKNA